MTLLWILTPLLVLFALARGNPVTHSALEAVPLIGLASVASLARVSRRLGATAASLGLITACALLVHLWDGRIEAHFSFFVILGVLVLYQDWVPYLIAIGYVVVHHTLMGALSGTEVFDHPQAQRQPLLWALIHGGFVLAASAASVVSWRANEQLLQARQEARTDELTGLLNRRGLYIEIERMLDTARTEARPTALLLLDLDRFKEVNDTLGHHAGDDLLRQVAGRLRACLPEAGMIGRLGGDEFVVMLAGADGPAGIALAAALADALDPPFELEGLLAPVQASVGVASAPADAVTRAELLRHADVAMYRAKTNGTGVALYAAEQDRHCRSRLQLAGELKAAIGTGQFILHYQPKGDLQTGEIIGVEALVRWQHPRRGLLYPDTFLSVAEEHGLMRSFTLDVIDSALAAQHSWRQRGLETPVAVNLAAANVLDPRFPQDVAESLQRWQLPPDALQLEITEDTIMTDLPRALDVLARLGEQGIHLALDDYGTGSSSLSYLKRLPIAELKIDRSFVINMTSDHSDAIIVRSTVELARNLGLHVVAEGVETAEHWEQLRACGCHTAQGYHLARPMAGDHYTAWMRERHTPSTTTSTTRPNTAS